MRGDELGILGKTSRELAVLGFVKLPPSFR
ncbi:hypothetical protein C9F11_46355 (plasmid) [Streptomyces sp. YIM 121038]|nr:hypothetical protein C9F11_45035 [Streptomyces sp. YIM 121038]QCX82821.1 hypothetical protein C9F11_46355 [Streptomyces sp. YIM 121038]